MSVSHDSSSAIVCKEVFDENSQPSEKEVLDYARRLGIDPDTEPQLLGLARDGLMAALPDGWTPVYDETAKTYYYYQRSTNLTTWEHPLDPLYKGLVAKARATAAAANNRRRSSVDDEGLEESDFRQQGGLPPTGAARIPAKLAPLKRGRSSEGRRSESSLERSSRAWKSGDTEHENARSASITRERVSRDYTNVRFQDPEFYQSPKIIESGRRKLDLSEVLNRSESLSPRHETEWRQLNSRFSSEENMIDVDQLSATSFKARTPETPGSESGHAAAIGSSPVKQLTLSGGGAIFLKRNRSRDVTPSRDDGRIFEDFHVAGSSGLKPHSVDDMTASAGERLKSILREKAGAEEEEKHLEEDRKSVRFDLHRVDIQTAVTSFNESVSDEDETGEASDADDRDSGSNISANIAAKHIEAVASLKRVLNRKDGPSFEPLEVKAHKLIGWRFVVENVSEAEHLEQQESRSIDSETEYAPSGFENVRNIDLVSKSDSERTTPRSVDSKTSYLEELRRDKEHMLQNMRKAKPSPRSDASEEGDRLSLELVRNSMVEEHVDEMRSLRQQLDAKLERAKTELESELEEQKRVLEAGLGEKLEQLRREMALREKREIQKLVEDMDAERNETLRRVRTELEAEYERERENLMKEMAKKRGEILERNEMETDVVERLSEGRGELEREHRQRVESLRKELDRELDAVRMDLRAQQRDKIAKITEDHEKCLTDILKDFRIDEGLARKLYKQRLEEIRADYSKDIENEMKKYDSAIRQETVEFEKIRCEKRLIEDKYNILKEKYFKMKKDMRAAIEKRNKRKQQANREASEAEMSTSARTRTERTESTDQKSPLTKTNSISNSKSKDASAQNASQLRESQIQQQQQQVQRVVATVTATTTPVVTGQAVATSAASSLAQMLESEGDTTTCSETTSNILLMSKRKKSPARKPNTGINRLNNNLVDNPVENIRKQLEKLEDLGDQLPTSDTAYTVRYPFHDKSPTNASSELEFFKHRIHVERVSVKRAREALRQQKSAFQSRQRAWEQRSSRATLEQLVKEERELSDMEVSLHRTRSLLGEKVIHLRHLERSLERMANGKRGDCIEASANTGPVKSDEATLSDMSSASSGFSSTDLDRNSDTFIESTEIIASLENLNSEIREIWGVLNKRQDNTMPPPPTLMFTDLSWFPYRHITAQPAPIPPPAAFGTPNIQSNILSQLTASHHPAPGTTQSIIAQYGPSSGYTTSVGRTAAAGATTTEGGAAASNLLERTRNLKDWLRQARVETTDLVSPGQATL